MGIENEIINLTIPNTCWNTGEEDVVGEASLGVGDKELLGVEGWGSAEEEASFFGDDENELIATEDENVVIATDDERDQQAFERLDSTNNSPVTPDNSFINTGVEIVKEPYVGMVFCSMDEIDAFYRSYAKKCGFRVNRVGSAKSKSSKSNGTVLRCYWKCECFGDPPRKKNSRGDAVDHAEKRPLKSRKCKCGAKLYAAKRPSDGKWVVKTFVKEHNNHDPTPSKSMHMYNHIPPNCMRRINFDRQVGIPTARTYASIACERNGCDQVPFSQKHLRNMLDKERRLKFKDGTSVAMSAYFERMKQSNSTFVNEFQTDDRGVVTDVIWVDSRSIAAYEEFGDVICFDTTYLTNDYELPFANMVGVNHHGQSVLLGCALLSHENIETFKWLFQCWLRAMGGKAPHGIITDQDAAVRSAIAAVLPNTRHWWCMWHILEKLPNKIGGYRKYDEISWELKQTVYESLTPNEFEGRWLALGNKYRLHGPVQNVNFRPYFANIFYM